MYIVYMDYSQNPRNAGICTIDDSTQPCALAQRKAAPCIIGRKKFFAFGSKRLGNIV